MAPTRFKGRGLALLGVFCSLAATTVNPATAATATPSTQKTASLPLSPEESLRKLHVPSGFRAELAAAEPLVLDPVAFDWDVRGRMWVVEMADYPLGMDGKGKPGGRVRILEDTDGDGRYDKSTVFADGLDYPNGIITWRDGAIVTAAPEILFLRDTNGDGKADERRVLVSGLQEGNQQLRANGLRWGLDNWVHVAIGGHHGKYGVNTRLKSARTGQDVLVGSRDFRFRPDSGELEPQSGPTQFGRNRDNWGRWFGTQNSNPLWHYVLPDHYLRRNAHFGAAQTLVQLLTPPNPPVYPASPLEKRFHSFTQAGHFTSACAGMIYRDSQLFPATETHAFVCEPFHNLVQHVRLTDSGVTFSARRASEDGPLDFFASEDRWCRPVMTREGPDGALWVADMYRYMIEHPDWLPKEGKAELLPHYREGDDRGRIYRISRIGTPAFRVPRLDKLDNAKLVTALDSSNGWQRDKVHQLLLWRADKADVHALRELAARNANPLARLHALCVLDGLAQLEPASVVRALSDSHPGVRENALRLAETRFTPEVLTAAVRLAEDPDAKVRLQLAFSLGASTNALAGESLGRLLIANAAEPMLVAAVMSSATPHLRPLIAAASRANAGSQGALTEPLLTIALGLNDRAALAQLLTPTLAPAGARHTPEQLAAFARLLDQLSQRNTTLDKLRDQTAGDALARLLDQARVITAQARATATDVGVPAVERIAAASLISRDTATRTEAVTLLTAWLAPQNPADTQAAAIRALASAGGSEVPALLAKAWPALSPAPRQVALSAWLGREPWAFDLAQRIERGELAGAAVDTTHRARLLKHDSKRVSQLATKAFSATPSAARSKIVDAYRPALTLKGEPARGRKVYLRICAACHRRGDDGRDIGPDMISVVGHPPEKLLASILDPNADIQPGYGAYTCTLMSGEEFYGLVAAETANSVTMKLADGSQKVVLRNQIAALRSQNLSLMPEGLETGVTPQEMADLIELLRTPVATKSR
ncbi:MAG: PVC-type heme-binding CxxCH protein [Limisphaerales bacterium]